MADKLICPFCGKKLYSSDNCYVCLNDDCIFCGFYFMEKRWKPIIELKQALMQTQHDLEICKQALINAKDKLEGAETSLLFLKCNLTAAGLRTEIADIDNTLKQITHDNSEKPNSQEYKE